MIAEGRSINVTLIFSLDRYQRGDGRLPRPASSATPSSRVPTWHRSPAWPASSSAASTPRSTSGWTRSVRPRRWRCAARRRSPRASWPTGCSRRRSAARAGRRSPRAAPRCSARCGRRTSTKNPAYPDTLYVDELIGPDTVNTLPDATIEAFADHGTLARRVDADVDEAEAVWSGARRRRRRHGRRGGARSSPRACPASRRASTSCSRRSATKAARTAGPGLTGPVERAVARRGWATARPSPPLPTRPGGAPPEPAPQGRCSREPATVVVRRGGPPDI